MTTQEAIQWFKNTFNKYLKTAVVGTPFNVDMLAAIAQQETGYIWGPLVGKKLTTENILALCVGDTLDADRGRNAFPKTKSDLLAAPQGNEMFMIARQALVEMAQYISGYSGAAKNPNKFCHGFGIFQYDLQYFQTDPAYFLQKKWKNFAACASKCVEELKAALKRQGWADKATLSDTEKVYIAIAYNSGHANPALGFKQGYKSDDGRYYGENIFEFLRIAQSIPVRKSGMTLTGPSPSAAPLPPPTPITVTPDIYEVDVREGPLRLRSEPKIPKSDPLANVIARLPDGQMVVRISGRKGDTFFEVETSVNGAHFRGFAAAEYLRPVKVPKAIPIVVPAAVAPSRGIVAVEMPRKPGTITRRADPAGPHSLNEPNQPARKGDTAKARCAELAAIIDWLAVDKASYKRYQPGGGSTFCNVYVHDYCFLAAVYLPRVWWTPGAIERLSQGENVEPLYEKTIDEQRANDLFRWLRDFGLRFGWRQTGTLTKLQEAANLGGLGIIVARRKIDGKSGHIVAVVPETDKEKATRNKEGLVTAPLQSQAGSINFRYGRGKPEWWKGEQFADNAFWIHA